jgi:DNA-binding winged helix-turn-helix (wHTH) protein
VLTYRVGPFTLHAERRVLVHQGKAVVVGRKAVETLLVLVERSGNVVDVPTLLQRLWPDRTVSEANLTQNVYVIRKLFQRYGGSNPIETHEAGYRLAIDAPRCGSSVHEVRGSPRRWVVAIASLVAVTLIAGSIHRAGPIAMGPPASSETLRLYAIGRYYLNLRSSAGVQKSVQYFSEAIERDPASPLGYVGMADANAMMGDYCYGAHRPRDYFARARAYDAQALVLDPDSAPAHATAGFILLHERQERRAIAELRLALGLDAGYAPAREWLGIALAREGRLSAARSQLELAAGMERPAVAETAWLASVAFKAGRIGEAVRDIAEVRDLSPSISERRLPPSHPTAYSVESQAATEILRN